LSGGGRAELQLVLVSDIPFEMDSRDSNVQQNHPTLCKNGCGFYSNAGNEGLCSVCYKDVVKKKQGPPTHMPSSFSPAPNSMASLSIDEAAAKAGACGGSLGAALETATTTVPCIPMASSSNSTQEQENLEQGAVQSRAMQEADKDGKKKKNRCIACKKKVGLTGFTCRCGGLFCSIHRYSDKHECGFDYKALGAEEISKSNPVVVAPKVAKI